MIYVYTDYAFGIAITAWSICLAHYFRLSWPVQVLAGVTICFGWWAATWLRLKCGWECRINRQSCWLAVLTKI